MTVPIGLGIGRLVFRALNLVEMGLAAVVVVLVGTGRPTTWITVLTAVVAAVLVGQLAVVRPRLNRRSDPVLAGENKPRSHAHLFYIGLEGAKVLALVALGVCLLAE